MSGTSLRYRFGMIWWPDTKTEEGCRAAVTFGGMAGGFLALFYLYRLACIGVAERTAVGEEFTVAVIAMALMAALALGAAWLGWRTSRGNAMGAAWGLLAWVALHMVLTVSGTAILLVGMALGGVRGTRGLRNLTAQPALPASGLASAS